MSLNEWLGRELERIAPSDIVSAMMPDRPYDGQPHTDTGETGPKDECVFCSSQAVIKALAERLVEVERERDALQELVWDVSGRSTEFAVHEQVKGILKALKEGNASEALTNTMNGLATALLLSIHAHRWAVLEHERADTAEQRVAQLEEALRWIAHFDDAYMETARTLHHDMKGRALRALEKEPTK